MKWRRLTLNRHPSLPFPAVNFEGDPEAFGSLLNQKTKSFVTPTEYFTTKFREIFTQTRITHNSGAESNKWLSGPNMIYWPQQLNFAFWCATTASGISRDVINSVPEQIKSFLLFHIYFMTRRILYEMGGIHSEATLPRDPTFSQTENKYDILSYKRICAEFGISPNTDFLAPGFSGNKMRQVHSSDLNPRWIIRLRWIICLQNLSKWTDNQRDEIRQIIRSNWRPSLFHIKTDLSLVWKRPMLKFP